MFKVYYEEPHTKPNNKIDEIDLSIDKDYGYEEFKGTLSWIKKAIKKGYRYNDKMSSLD